MGVGAAMRVLKAGNGEVLALAFSPDGRALAGAVEHHGVYLWNLQSTGTPVRLDPIPPTRAKARSLFFAPDGRTVHWLAWSGGWKAYDRDARETVQPKLPARGFLVWLAQLPDGSRLLSEHTFPESSLVGWAEHAGRWEQQWSVSTANLAVHSTTVCPTGEWVATLARNPHGRKPGDVPFRLQLRSADSGAVRGCADYPHEEECDLVFAPDGSQLVGVHKMTLLVWPVPGLGPPRLVRNDSRRHFTAAAYHPSGRHLFATSNDTTVHVFDTRGWGRASRFTWELGRLRAVAVSPDGTLAAAGGDRGEVVVWDVDL